MPVGQPDEPVAVGGAHLVDPVPRGRAVDPALQDELGSIGGHVPASQVETGVGQPVERHEARAVRQHGCGSQRLRGPLGGGVVRDQDPVARRGPPSARGSESEVGPLRAVGRDGGPRRFLPLRVPVADEQLAGRHDRGRRHRTIRLQRPQREEQGAKRHDHCERAGGQPPVPLASLAVPVEALERSTGLALQSVDRELDVLDRNACAFVQRHRASSSPNPSRRANACRPSNRCFLTVPGAISRTSAISATGRSSR